MTGKITAAPIVRKNRSEMPAPAYTDFISIFLDMDLNVKESNVAMRHEQAHIWCEHNRRFKEGMKHDIWQIACEIEIARNIYNQDDMDVIAAPRSRLAGGYLPDSIKQMPVDLLLAEDIYEWILNNPDKMPQSQKSMCACDCSSNASGDKQTQEPQKAIEAAKDGLESLAAEKQSQEDISSVLKSMRFKQPSLADEVDALLRHRVVRERSYKRPSRRECDASVISKGRFSSLKRPLVEVFVDRSGSFCAEKTKIAELALKNILMKYGVQVKSDVFYFGSDRLSSKDIRGGGNTPYHLIIQHLSATKPKIAVVITDDDSCADTSVKLDCTKVLCLPVGASRTDFAAKVGGKDVSIN